jgi:hypothetical protein
MEKSIVCGVDGSADSQAALAVAAVSAGSFGLAPAPRPLTATLGEQVGAGERLLDTERES